jgi:hypothetical protein
MLSHPGEGGLIGVNDHHFLIFQRQPLGDVKAHFPGADDDNFQSYSFNG